MERETHTHTHTHTQTHRIFQMFSEIRDVTEITLPEERQPKEKGKKEKRKPAQKTPACLPARLLAATGALSAVERRESVLDFMRLEKIKQRISQYTAKE